MIISRTPLRVSFAGGGTDLADYYRTGFGAVVSCTIRKYVYVTVNKRFDDDIRVSYSKTEIVNSVDELEHGLVREALKKVGIRNGIEITTIADIPSKGTGLGSSSAITVGLLNALYAFKGYRAGPKKLAEEACEIEIDKLGEPIGKQDQYIAAYGGIQHIRFNADDTVVLDPVITPAKTKREIENHLMLFYTGRTRQARDILSKQKDNTHANRKALDAMRNQRDSSSVLSDSLTMPYHCGFYLEHEILPSETLLPDPLVHDSCALNRFAREQIPGVHDGLHMSTT